MLSWRFFPFLSLFKSFCHHHFTFDSKLKAPSAIAMFFLFTRFPLDYDIYICFKLAKSKCVFAFLPVFKSRLATLSQATLLLCAAAKKHVIPLAAVVFTSHWLSNRNSATSLQPLWRALKMGGFPSSSQIFMLTSENIKIKHKHYYSLVNCQAL